MVRILLQEAKGGKETESLEDGQEDKVKLMLTELSELTRCVVSSREEWQRSFIKKVRRKTWTRIVIASVAEPPLFWAAPDPVGQCSGADSGSDLLGSAPAPSKKRRLQAKKGGSGPIHQNFSF